MLMQWTVAPVWATILVEPITGSIVYGKQHLNYTSTILSSFDGKSLLPKQRRPSETYAPGSTLKWRPRSWSQRKRTGTPSTTTDGGSWTGGSLAPPLRDILAAFLSRH